MLHNTVQYRQYLSVWKPISAQTRWNQALCLVCSVPFGTRPILLGTSNTGIVPSGMGLVPPNTQQYKPYVVCPILLFEPFFQVFSKTWYILAYRHSVHPYGLVSSLKLIQLELSSIETISSGNNVNHGSWFCIYYKFIHYQSLHES